MNGVPVITLLQFTAGNYTLPAPLIYHIGQSSLASLLARYRHTPDSELLLYCPATDQVICSTSDALNREIHSLLQQSESPESLPNIFSLNGKKYYCCVSVSRSGYSDPLVFLSLIPYSDVLSHTTVMLMLTLLTLLLCGVGVTALSFYFSFRLYMPIRNIVNTIRTAPIQRMDKSSADELLFLDRNIQNLMVQNQHLQANMSSALPLLYSRYILNLLYQKDYDNQSLEPLLADFDFCFPYSSFVCAVLIPRFSEAYRQDFTDTERNLIMGKLSEILTLTQDNTYVKYVFHITENEFCIITNFSHDNPRELLYRDFMALQELFSFDKDYIHFYIAFGSSSSSIRDIHASWKDANRAMATLSVFQSRNICFFEPADSAVSTYVAGPDDDNQLSGALYKGDHDLAFSVLSQLIKANELLRVQDEGFKNLYVHLYELASSTALRKELDCAEIMGADYVHLSDFIHNLNNLQRSEYLRSFYEKLCRSQRPETESAFDLSGIKDYVDTHFCEDLYLELLAERFRTTPKYMSRLLKQALGTPFKQYISNLRIEKARELLFHTDKTVEEIAVSCGFTNRYSFIRVFKQLQGLTPSEYRKHVAAAPEQDMEDDDSRNG